MRGCVKQERVRCENFLARDAGTAKASEGRKQAKIFHSVETVLWVFYKLPHICRGGQARNLSVFYLVIPHHTAISMHAREEKMRDFHATRPRLFTQLCFHLQQVCISFRFPGPWLTVKKDDWPQSQNIATSPAALSCVAGRPGDTAFGRSHLHPVCH